MYAALLKRPFPLLILTLALMTTLRAQQSPQGAAAAPAAKEEEYVTEKGFRTKIFEIKHRDPNSLRGVLIPLGSGVKGAVITSSREFKTLTVRDFPENIATIEEALKRLDAPESKQQPDIELRMHLFIASNIETATNAYPAELNPVIKQLQSTLSYKSYYLATSLIQRVKDGANQVAGNGFAELAPPLSQTGNKISLPYSYAIFSVNAEASSVQLDGFSFTINAPQLGQAGVRSRVGLGDGEKVVVGTASLQDKALVLVITAKVIRSYP